MKQNSPWKHSAKVQPPELSKCCCCCSAPSHLRTQTEVPGLLLLHGEGEEERQLLPSQLAAAVSTQGVFQVFTHVH